MTSFTDPPVGRCRDNDAGKRPHLKFDVAKLERVNDPERFETLVPERMWDALGRPADARFRDIEVFDVLPWHLTVIGRKP